MGSIIICLLKKQIHHKQLFNTLCVIKFYISSIRGLRDHLTCVPQTYRSCHEYVLNRQSYSWQLRTFIIKSDILKSKSLDIGLIIWDDQAGPPEYDIQCNIVHGSLFGVTLAFTYLLNDAFEH
jgi:hypothetical protein